MTIPLNSPDLEQQLTRRLNAGPASRFRQDLAAGLQLAAVQEDNAATRQAAADALTGDTTPAPAPAEDGEDLAAQLTARTNTGHGDDLAAMLARAVGA